MTDADPFSKPDPEPAKRRESLSKPRKPRLPTEERLTRQALHYLDRYASSSANLRKVLERKIKRAAQAHEKDPAEFEPLIDLVLEKCLRSGVVNDETFAQTKLASLRRKGQSTRKITATLSAKGVERETIERVLADDDSDEDSVARRYAKRRRLGPYRTSQRREDNFQKDLAAMCRAGFSYGLARRILEETPEDQPED